MRYNQGMIKSLGAILGIRPVAADIHGLIKWQSESCSELPCYLASCDKLGIHIQSRTYAELIEDIEFAHQVIFTSELVNGTLDRFLAKRNLRVTPPTEELRAKKFRKVKFNVPFSVEFLGENRVT